jgi:hypothetical protein
LGPSAGGKGVSQWGVEVVFDFAFDLILDLLLTLTLYLDFAFDLVVVLAPT